jgi:L,D-peptidoglycan transpeptidase YkuD (ErfK/YbiS/YcfS/YnhG family)
MRRTVFLPVLALLLLSMPACAKMDVVYKDVPAVSAAAAAEAVAVSPAEMPVSAKPDTTKDTPAPVAPAASASSEPAAAPAVSVADTIPAASADARPSAEDAHETGGEQPPLLAKAVEGAGLSFDDFAFSQLVLVSAEGSNAAVYCYDKDDNSLWKVNKTLGRVKGYVGKNGVSFSKREGDNCTPGGLFTLGFAFGNNAEPETAMVFRPVTAESYWVDDPNSKYYNQWVEGKTGSDWSSAEYLSGSKKYYAYAVVVEYNMPDAVPGKGSAIFLHCKNEPTTGCVAVPEDSMLKILAWLDPEKNPKILIMNK